MSEGILSLSILPQSSLSCAKQDKSSSVMNEHMFSNVLSLRAFATFAVQCLGDADG